MTTTREHETDGSSFGDPKPEPGSARTVVNEMVDAGLLDDLMSRVDHGTLQLTGEGGFLPEMIKAVLERGLQAEMAGHLGYEKGERSQASPNNSRNGSTPKTVASEIGEIALATPRDRDGSFQPALVPKGTRRIGGLDEMIISLYAGGMTVRDIQHHLARTLGTDLSHETIANVTDAVLEEVQEWQNRPLDEIYPIIYLDALVVKVLDGHHVMNRSAYIAVGIDLEGIKHVLGIWVQAAEGAKFWAGVCAELANRGVKDVLIVCCDGLTGFPEAIEATWPHATVQTCVVHLIRAAMRFISYQDRRKVATALRPIYTAPSVDAARMELDAFSDSVLGHKYPAAAAVWERAWERFIPFLTFPEAVRHIIYTTNAIESLNYQLRKITKNRGHFPNDTAVVKLLWLAIRDIEDKRARERIKNQGKHLENHKQSDRLVEGAGVMGWNAALGALAIVYPDRINSYL